MRGGGGHYTNRLAVGVEKSKIEWVHGVTVCRKKISNVIWTEYRLKLRFKWTYSFIHTYISIPSMPNIYLIEIFWVKNQCFYKTSDGEERRTKKDLDSPQTFEANKKYYNTLLLSDNATNTNKQKIIFSRSNWFIMYLDHVVVITSPDSWI